MTDKEPFLLKLKEIDKWEDAQELVVKLSNEQDAEEDEKIRESLYQAWFLAFNHFVKFTRKMKETDALKIINETEKLMFGDVLQLPK